MFGVAVNMHFPKQPSERSIIQGLRKWWGYHHALTFRAGLLLQSLLAAHQSKNFLIEASLLFTVFALAALVVCRNALYSIIFSLTGFCGWNSAPYDSCSHFPKKCDVQDVIPYCDAGFILTDKSFLELFQQVMHGSISLGNRPLQIILRVLHPFTRPFSPIIYPAFSPRSQKQWELYGLIIWTLNLCFFRPFIPSGSEPYTLM